MRAALGLAAWRLAGTIAAPALRVLLRRRLARGKELPGRLGERRGRHAGPRPPGPLVWLHAASVGELNAVRPVIVRLLGTGVGILVTTATATAAGQASAMIAETAGPGLLLHRMVPLDVPRWVGRFLDGWRPDAAVFVESELWPNALGACRRRGIPLVLLNGRLSERSARAWARVPRVAAAVLGGFEIVWARSDEDARRLASLGATVARVGDLKADAPPLPADPAVLASLERRLGDRPRWLLASTHEGEERLAGRVHARLAPRHAGLLTIVAPRHPSRGPEIAAALGAAPRRAAGASPPDGAGLWVADTLGELGLFYRLAPVVFLGRSLGGDGGGQNPWEPARLGCALVCGPGTRNFRESVSVLSAGGALTVVDGEAALADAIGSLLGDPAAARAQGERARALARDRAPGLTAAAAAMLAARVR